MNDLTIIKNYAAAIDGNAVDRLNIDLDYGFKLAGRNVSVRALCHEYRDSVEGVEVSAESMQMSLGAAIAIAEFFGTRGKADKAINNYNLTAKTPSYNVRTLKQKLVSKDAPKPKSSPAVAAAKAVKPMTDAQWKAFVAAENKRRGL